MNLGKLLGAGKSFVSGRKPASYRADRRVYLPQFVSPKNPFVSPAPGGTQAELPKSSAETPIAPPEKIASLWMKTRKTSEVTTQRATTWVSRLNPVSIFRTGPLPLEKNAMPVQVELSLEKIKVVHNDLTDADVKVVPMKSRPARSKPENHSAKKSWENLGKRIIKATAL